MVMTALATHLQQQQLSKNKTRPLNVPDSRRYRQSKEAAYNKTFLIYHPRPAAIPLGLAQCTHMIRHNLLTLAKSHTTTQYKHIHHFPPPNTCPLVYFIPLYPLRRTIQRTWKPQRERLLRLVSYNFRLPTASSLVLGGYERS